MQFINLNIHYFIYIFNAYIKKLINNIGFKTAFKLK